MDLLDTSSQTALPFAGQPADGCADCGSLAVEARGRCHKCYQRHIKVLKKSGSFTSLHARPTRDRILERAVAGWGGCIIWIGRLDKDGYGAITVDGRPGSRVHRVTYEAFVGPIPNGLEIDHLCHHRDKSCPSNTTCVHRRCINPEHLEPVTHRTNVIRSLAVDAGRATCIHGHPWTEANTFVSQGQRRCRLCRNERARRYKAEKTAGGRAAAEGGAQ